MTALAILAGLLTWAKDLKIAPIQLTPPVTTAKLPISIAPSASRPAIKIAPRAIAPSSPMMPMMPMMQAAGPVAAYGFSETAGATTADASGNANTGTMIGGVTRITTGKFGNAMRFDGSSGAVRIADSPTWKVSGLTGYTISMWVKVNSAVGDYKSAIGKGGWPAEDLLINKTGNTWQFRIRTNALTCGGTTAPVSYLATVDNTYHHIALVMDSTKGNCQFYSDGVVIGTDEYVSGTTVFATGTGKNDLYIGGLDGGRQFLNADIDEVRLYTRALSLAELQADMATPVDGAPPPPPPDTTPPVISGVASSSITTTGATISWTTNEASDTQIEYGTTTAYGQTTTLDPAMTTTHSQALTGLTPNTLYNYRVLSRDAAGNLATSANFTFTTLPGPDTTPPVLTNIAAGSVTSTSAVVTWRTSELANSQVEYGTTTAYGSTTTLNTTLANSHSHSLSGLTANTLYHYRVHSRDAAGNLATSGDLTFYTQPELTSFQDALWVGGMNASTSMEFAPDGRLFVCEKGGAVRVIQNGQLLATPFFTASVNSDGERGLLGIAFDPNFATNQYVYIYYTATSPNVHNRVSRLTANGNVAVAGSETALLDLPTATGVSHQGGAIHFGNDGKLYIAVGDHLQPENAQSLSFMFGKMLRINSDGTIPTDNPFYAQTTGIFRAIYAVGFRNPFTFAVDPVTGRIFVNDVGNTDWEEINQLVAGANYGWPTCEGPQGTGTGTCTSTSFTYPIHAYAQGGGDAAITGGVFYRGSQYPSQYYGDYFFSDYTADWIRFLDTENQVQGVNNPSSLFRDTGPPLDLKVGPDGAIYYLSFSGRVSRITYASGNRPPTAAFTATPNAGTPPLAVSFNGSTSSDPDSDPLTYTWVFGDGTPNGSGPTVNHTYTAAGVYTATLTVNDGRGGQHSTTTQILVGNAPVATILTPGEGSFYNAGDIIQYSGSGMDVDEGTLSASAFSWTVVFHHGTHTHPFLGPINGVTGGSFQTEQTHETATDVWYRIHLRVTDSQGLTHEVYRDIHPNIAAFTLTSNIPGATLTLDGQPVVTPYTTSGVVGTQRSIGVPSPQTIGGTEHVFVSWSDNGAATHTITTPATATTYTATLRPAGPLSTNWLPPSVQVFQNFNLALPLSTTNVAGLEVLLNLKVMSLASAPQISVELSWDGGISWTPAKSPPAPTTTEQMFIVGSATDLWGRAGWTTSELTNTNFRVRVTTVSTSPTRDFLLDVAGVRLTGQ
jgi:glucose/arabinose dehydrogenase